MEYCFLKGVLLGLLMQRCTSEGLPSSVTSTVVTPGDIHTAPLQPEFLPADVGPVVAPPSLEDVHQAVQEASEQVEGRGAEEVLKELLERVVEAALGQVDGGNEGKPNEKWEQEGVGEDTVPESLEEAEGTGTTIVGEVTGEDQAESDMEVFENTDEEEAVEEGRTEGGGSMMETTTGGDNSGRVSVGVRGVAQSLGTENSRPIAAQEGTGGDSAVEEVQVEEHGRPGVLSGETPALEETTEQETVVDTDHRLGAADGVEEVVEDSQVDEIEGEVIIQPSVVEETAEKVHPNRVEEPEEDIQDEKDPSMVEGGAAEEVGAVGGELEESEGEGATRHESESSDHQAEEELSPLDPSHENEGHEAPEPEDGAEASEEQIPENQASTSSPSLSEAEAQDNTLDNEIISPTGDLLPRDSSVAQPTLDYVLAIPPQADREDPGQANELVEDTPAEISELGLEAWRIGAVAAAVFLVLETVVIIIYVLRCHNKNRSVQRSCEEGVVEPEAATGGDCSDDTIPATDGDTQLKMALGPPDAALTLEPNNENAIIMSNSSSEESADTGPALDPSQEVRTSAL